MCMFFAVIDKGVVREQGTHAELLHQDGIYAKLVSRQLQRQANVIEAATHVGGGGAGVVTTTSKGLQAIYIL